MLPEYCYALHPVTKRPVIVYRGERGYVETNLEKTDAEGVKMLNDLIGVTPAQAEAMFVGSMFGWHVPGANPENYDENGRLVK